MDSYSSFRDTARSPGDRTWNGRDDPRGKDERDVRVKGGAGLVPTVADPLVRGLSVLSLWLACAGLASLLDLPSAHPDISLCSHSLLQDTTAAVDRTAQGLQPRSIDMSLGAALEMTTRLVGSATGTIAVELAPRRPISTDMSPAGRRACPARPE